MNSDRKPWTRWLLALQGLLAVLLAVGLAGHKFELLPFKIAFLGVLLALAVAFAAGALGLLVVLWSWVKKAPHLRLQAGWVTVIGVAPILVVIAVVGPKNFDVPAIHDISTDTENPPRYVAAKRERSAAENTLEYPGAEVAGLQRQAYPEVKPLISDLPADEAFSRSLAAVRELGWHLLEQDAAAGRIEAIEETAMFGFKDDVIIRITAQGAGSRVDTRSVSRVGKSDLGANAARILRFQRVFNNSVK